MSYNYFKISIWQNVSKLKISFYFWWVFNFLQNSSYPVFLRDHRNKWIKQFLWKMQVLIFCGKNLKNVRKCRGVTTRYSLWSSVYNAPTRKHFILVASAGQKTWLLVRGFRRQAEAEKQSRPSRQGPSSDSS